MVDRDQTASASGDEAERPTPSLALRPKTGDAHSVGAGGDMVTTASGTSGAAADNTTTRWLSGSGLALGALALAIGNTLRRRPQ